MALEIDHEHIVASLTKADGSVHRAAKTLGIKTPELRKIINANRALEEDALETVELAIDKAEAGLLRSLREGPLADRLKAASFILKRSRRGRR